MGVTLMLTSSIIFIIFISGYLKVLYESVRKVRIANSYKLPKRTEGVKEKNTNGTPVSGSKILKETLLINEYKQAPGPLPWPVLGNLDLLGRYESPFQAFTELAKKYGDTYSLTLGTTRCLIVNNLDPIREVLNQNGKFFGGRPDFIRFHILFGGNRNNYRIYCNCNGDTTGICPKVYVGTTTSKLKTRLSFHKSDRKARGKPIEQQIALAAHCALKGHRPNLDEVEILAEERRYSQRFTMEMLHIINIPAEKRLN